MMRYTEAVVVRLADLAEHTIPDKKVYLETLRSNAADGAKYAAPSRVFVGSEVSRRAAAWFAGALSGYCDAAGLDIPELATQVITELGVIKKWADEINAGQMRGRELYRMDRCELHGGYEAAWRSDRCPGCVTLAYEHPEGCQVCTPGHPWTEPCWTAQRD